MQLSKKICIYRINSGVAPEVMPHCAQKLFYIRVTSVTRNSCVSMAGLRDVLVMFWTPHHTAACPVMTTRDLFARQSCSWVTHTRCHRSRAGELLGSASSICKHSELISLASIRGIIFQQALYYMQPLYLQMTPYSALKYSFPLGRGKDEFLVPRRHISSTILFT